MRTQFGLQKIEKSLVTIQMKLMELINKNYVLKTRETVSLHRDFTMKNIEINKLVDRLLESIRLVLRSVVTSENRSRTPLKAIVSNVGGGEGREQWVYSREESMPKLTKMRYESRKQKEALAHREGLFRNKSASVTKRETSDKKENPPAELQSEFTSNIKILLENIKVAVKRGNGLAIEYKKIDENLQKLVKFLSSKQRSSLLQRYSSMLGRSEYQLLSEKAKNLASLEHQCKQTVLQSLQDSYGQLKQDVNALKNQTKERRDILIVMVRNDKLTVENVHTSPKKF